MTFLEVLDWVVKQDILDIRSRSAFGILLCGVLIGVIVSVVAFAKLKLSENELGLPLMNYQDVLVVIMTAATFFLGVIIPLAGIFAFVLVRKDVTFKVEELVNNEMLETGKLMNAVRSTAADVAIKQYVDEGG